MIVGACLFVAALSGLAVTGRLPLTVPVVYIAVSVVTFLIYRADKSAARSDAWRTPESTLHLLALIGGWPGAAIAQKILHHKSRKAAFQATFWLTVIGNCAAVAWLYRAAFFDAR